MGHGESVTFIIDCIGEAATTLANYQFWGVDLLMWFFGFTVIGMVVSVFWRGARG